VTREGWVEELTLFDVPDGVPTEHAENTEKEIFRERLSTAVREG
jgi:hypothetical protein